MWILIGEGPNSVNIPCLVWSSEEKAMKDCKELFGSDPKKKKDDNGKWQYRWYNEDGEFPEEVLNKMFKFYSGGCGECYAATLMEIEEGKPFVGWDLD